MTIGYGTVPAEILASQQLATWRGTMSDLERANFTLAHNGQTPEQYAESERKRVQSDWEDRILADLQDEPLSGLGANILNISPQKARYARYKAWLRSEETKLADAQRKLAVLDGLVEAPRETESAIKAMVRRTADFLLGRGDDADVTERAELDSRLAVERHRSEAATAARPEIEREVEIAELRVTRLREREVEFLRPAVIEHALKSGIAERYNAAVDAYAEALSEIHGLATEFSGGEWNDSLSCPDDVTLPGCRKLGIKDRKIFARDSDRRKWRQLAYELRCAQ